MRLLSALRALHRDVGFFAVGLTLVYAVSGVAVNHRQDWNYNQSTRLRRLAMGTPGDLMPALSTERRTELIRDPGGALSAEEEKQLVLAVGSAAGRAREPRNAFWRGHDRLSLFYAEGERDTIDYDPRTGVATFVETRDRPVLRQLNYLHLNEGRRFWTWIADGFAVVLAFLAVSGLFLVRGRKGLRGRGGLLAALGLLLPLLAWVLLRA